MRYLLTLMVLSFTGLLFAQVDTTDSPATIHLLAKYTTEGTYLRWGYGDADAWYANFREGVVLERRRVSPEQTEYQAVDIVKLLPSEELQALTTETRDEMLSVVHSMAYEDWGNSLAETGDDDLLDKRDNFVNRYGLYHFAADRSRTAARAAGLGYLDTDVAPNVTYAYRVRSLGTKKVVALKVVAPVVRDVRPLISDVVGEERAVKIRWERALHNRYYSGYHIERADAQNDTWTRLTKKAPFVQGYDPENLGSEGPQFFSFRDSTTNEKPYRYRIIGLDAFGEESRPSPVVIGQGTDRTPPPAPLLRVDQDEKLHRIRTLYWTQPEGEAVFSYHLQRKFKGGEEVVIDFANAGDTLKVDEPDEPGSYIYRLIAQDKAGNLAWSEEVYTVVFDLTPPSKPAGLTANVDTSGLVILTWDEGSADTYGYHIYAADGNNRAFERITNRPHRWRRFVDTVSTSLLNEYRDYYVVATDKDFLYSEKSEVLRVRRPDVIPPAPAQISDFEVRNTGIYLALRPSHSNDASTHRLLRKEKGAEKFTAIGEWTHPTYPPFNHLDTTAEQGMTYRYAYQAEDDGGLRSAIISEVQVAMKAKQLRAPVLTGVREGAVVTLSWNPNTGAAGWQLYRSIDGGPATRLPAVTGDRQSFSDGRVKAGQTASYRLRLIRTDGKRSPFSEPFEISL